MRSPRLAALELRRFGRGKLPRAALVALLVLPLLYGALYLWSFWDPYGRLDRIPVALVNDDKGAKAGDKKLAAGQSQSICTAFLFAQGQKAAAVELSQGYYKQPLEWPVKS